MSIDINPSPPSLPDQYSLMPGDGSMCTRGPAPATTLDVSNDQHQRVAAITENRQANTVTVKAFNPATGAQTGVDTLAVGSDKRFHEVSGTIPVHEEQSVGLRGMVSEKESLKLHGYVIDLSAHDQYHGFLDLFRETKTTVSVSSAQAGTVSLNGVAGDGHSLQSSYTAPEKPFNLFDFSTW